jgi:hypothetical protein
VSSPWVGLDRDAFRLYVEDAQRLNRLRHDRTYFLQSGWADERGERRPPRPEWTPPVRRPGDTHKRSTP